ncbi:MAG: signal peptidase I [Treponemataceae bacterium]|nr:signal peptidase I [Treponemataceae bacterium]
MQNTTGAAEPAPPKSTFLFLMCLSIGIAAGIVLKLFVLDILRVSGSSMEPAVRDNSVVFVNKLAYGLVKPFHGSFLVQWGGPRVGDIVIFLHDDKFVIKRCAAVSGGRLDFSADSGYSMDVGGETVALTEEQFNRMKSSSVVPDGYILALGDNRAESVDSRNYGFVSVKNITGKIIGK